MVELENGCDNLKQTADVFALLPLLLLRWLVIMVPPSRWCVAVVRRMAAARAFDLAAAVKRSRKAAVTPLWLGTSLSMGAEEIRAEWSGRGVSWWWHMPWYLGLF